jgi:regulator of sigma E protease
VNSVLWNAFYFTAGLLITLSILIFVHELGHFMAAKRSGVRVERFSIGFGPRIVGFRRGETEYVISVVPFGGYVRMAGEDPEAESTGGDWEFLAKSKRTRALIVAAGPVMNFVLALVILICLAAAIGVETIPSSLSITVGEDSPAEEAGLRPKDAVIALNGDSVATWEAVDAVLAASLGKRIEAVVERDGVPVSTMIELRDVKSVAEVGIGVFYDAVIGNVAWRGPAHKAGLRRGDRVIRIDGAAVGGWNDLREAVLPSAGDTLDFVWERNGEQYTASVIPKEQGGSGYIEATAMFERRPAGVIESVRFGAETALWAARQVRRIPEFFGSLFRGQASSDAIGGPIRIGEVAGDALRWGLPNFLWFLALISAQLSIINLIPIPVLDGGHILLLGIETVTRRPITSRQRVIAHQIGFAFLFGFMILITLFDISRFFGR